MINIHTAIHEPKSLGVRQLPDDIKSVVLQPDPKIECSLLVRAASKSFLQLLKKCHGSRVYQRLEGHQGAHGVGVGYGSAEPSVKLLISGVKERLEGPAVGYCLLDRVEFRLQTLLERVGFSQH